MFIFQMGPKLSLSGGRGESKTYFQPPEKKNLFSGLWTSFVSLAFSYL